MTSPFHLTSTFSPKGDQPKAIEKLSKGLHDGLPHQVLLGVTGSGKTFTMANVIQNVGRPALVIAPNKTLAAQLYNEFKSLFPENAVEYFVSYYDYYQPEAYIPQSDTYIQKDALISDRIDKLRHSATRALLERNDVDRVINACDAGREGELIFREIRAYAGDSKPVSRLWLQSMTPRSVSWRGSIACPPPASRSRPSPSGSFGLSRTTS